MFMTTHIDLFKYEIYIYSSLVYSMFFFYYRQWIIHLSANIDMHLRNKLSTFLDDIPTLVIYLFVFFVIYLLSLDLG